MSFLKRVVRSSVSDVRTSLITRSFFPFAARFLRRHPKKLRRVFQYWLDYAGRFEKISSLTERKVEEIEKMLYYIELEEPLFAELDGLRGVPMNCIVYYVFARIMEPDIIVETGVNAGASSRFILLAMEQNKHGVLHSIDLPNQDVELFPGGPRQKDGLPEGKETGFLVPDALKARWELHIGDAQNLLPQLLRTLSSIDIFIHDSLHTYDHMMFEYRTAWPYLREGGILLSDDTDYNAAFSDFAADVQHGYIKFDYRVGAIRKGRKIFDYQ